MAQATLFPLDPVRTQLTAPVSSAAVQGSLDTSLTTQTRSAGIKSFTDALSRLAVRKKANDIHNDTITAELAAAYEKEQPGGLQSEARLAYIKAVDLKGVGKNVQALKDYVLLEGADILNDTRLSRQDRMSHYKTGLLNILNTAKQGISPVNAAELFPMLETVYYDGVSTGNVELAKDRKEEHASTNAQAIHTLVGENFNQIADAAALQISGSTTIVEDDDLTPEQHAFIVTNIQVGLATKGLSVKKVNAIVQYISTTKSGADNRQIKASVIASISYRVLQAIKEKPMLADPNVITNLIDNMKGDPNVKGSTLRTEIIGKTEYSKVFDEIEKNFHIQYKSILDTLKKSRTETEASNDSDIFNAVFDSADNRELYPNEQSMINQIRGMVNQSKQIAATKWITSYWKGGPKNAQASNAYIEALLKSNTVLTADGTKIDESAFAALVVNYNLSDAAAKTLKGIIDPVSKASKHRKDVLENGTIVLLKNKFANAAKAVLDNNDFRHLIADMEGMTLEDGPVVLAKLKTKIGDGRILNHINEIFKAEIEFSKTIERLIRDNPELSPIELADKVQLEYNQVFNDVLMGVKPGTTKQGLEEIRQKERETSAASSQIAFGEDGELILVPGTPSPPSKPTVVSPAEAVKEAEEVKRQVLTKVLKDTKNPVLFQKYVDAATKELTEKTKLIEAHQKLSGKIPSSRQERMRIIWKHGGIISEEAAEQTKKSMAAIATNPELAIVIRAKSLQQKGEKEKIEIANNIYFNKTSEEALEKRIAGGEIFTVPNPFGPGVYQLTVEAAKDFPGNVSFAFQKFYETIRVFPKGGRPKILPKEEGEEPSTVIEKAGETVIDAISDILSVSEAEGAATSQDADFDPKAEGPRGFTGPESKPLAVKPEKAFDSIALDPMYEERFAGGTSEESDIEGFLDENIGEEVDMPPVYTSTEQVEKAVPNFLSGLIEETQIEQSIKKRIKELPKDTKNSQQIAKATMGIAIPKLAETLANVIQGYLTNVAPARHMLSYAYRATKFSVLDKLGWLGKEEKQNLTQLESFIQDNAQAVFSRELKKTGLTVPSLIEHMRLIYMAETNIGMNVKDSVPTKAGDRSAIGDLQVMATTFKDLIGKQFGKDAATKAGLDYKELLKLKEANNKDALEALLRNKNVNFMAGMAKMMQYLEVKSKRK